MTTKSIFAANEYSNLSKVKQHPSFICPKSDNNILTFYKIDINKK